jgi:hypothetical protein
MILSEVCLPFPKEWVPEWPEPLAQLNELWKTKMVHLLQPWSEIQFTLKIGF